MEEREVQKSLMPKGVDHWGKQRVRIRVRTRAKIFDAERR